MEEANKLKLRAKILIIQRSSGQRLGATAASGAIILQAEMSDDVGLKRLFSDLRGFISPLGLDTHHYFAGSILVSLISQTELFLADLIKLVVAAYPQKLGNIEFKFKDIIEKSYDEILELALDRYISSLMYKRPLEYFDEFCKILSIERESILSYWRDFVEAKARRDLGLHNNWIVNDTYQRKINEIEYSATAPNGTNICPNHDYITNIHDVCLHIVEIICIQVIKKYCDIGK